MDVSRVGQRPDALLQESGSSRRDTRAAERQEPQARVEQAQPREPKKAEKVAPREPEPARPVVNTQGQTTGTRINTSA